MLFEEPPLLGKHDAEEPRFVASKKQRWEHSKWNENQESEDLLAWELEQEQWTDKSEAALLADPHWQRVGIRMGSSSDDEHQQTMTDHLSPTPAQSIRSPTYQESPRPPMSPARSLSQAVPGSFFLEDQRFVHKPSTPVMSPGTALSPSSARSVSPSPSVRSASAYNRFPMHLQSPNYGFYPATKNAYGMDGQLTMRMKPYSLPLAVRPNHSTTSRSPYSTMPRDDSESMNTLLEKDIASKIPIASAYQQVLSKASSWNSFSDAMSPIEAADQLEAEYEWLERGRQRSFGYSSLDERDEKEVMRSMQGTNISCEMVPELGQEQATLKSVCSQDPTLKVQGRLRQTQEPILKSPVLLEDPEDGVIHLEDHPSLAEDEPEGSESDNRYAIEELKSEALRRKEALMRNCSMDSNEEGDDILGDTLNEKPKEETPQRNVRARKFRWQEKLERFERRGHESAEANSDVSRYPRLQQIRQRRRERLKALMTIRQERAEIWNTLEANWEHMENSMTRMLGGHALKSRGPDPEPASNDKNRSSRDVPLANDFDSNVTLPSSTSMHKSTETVAATDAAPKGLTVAAEETKVTPSETTNGDNGMEESQPTVVARKESKLPANASEAPKSPRKSASSNSVLPEATVSLLKSITCTATGKVKDIDVLVSDCGNPGTTSQREDPPPSFGAIISRSMSDVGTKVVRILGAGKSGEEQVQETKQQQQQSEITQQGTDTAEEETDEAREDDETSHGLGLDVAGFEEDDEDLPDQQGCVNPLRGLIGKQRRLVVEDVTGQGCMNPLSWHFGFGRYTGKKGQGRVRTDSAGYASALPANGYSGSQDDGARDNRGEDEPGPLGGSHSQSDDRDVVAENTKAVTSKKLRRSKKSKHKKPAGDGDATGSGVDTFFTLVDDLLINKILNIMDEKSVDKVAHTFGFD